MPSAQIDHAVLLASDLLGIGELSRRSGVAVSALRFYESEGLLRSVRSAGGHRLFARSNLRVVAVIRVAQSVGLSLPQIGQALAGLPESRSPSADDWQSISSEWLPMLEAQIASLQRLRDQLTSCIGCGCLSLARCPLYNPQDRAAQRGEGPRHWLGDAPIGIEVDDPAMQNQ